MSALTAWIGRGRKAKASKRSAHTVEYSLLLTATLGLVAFGAVMIFSASSSASVLNGGDSLYYLKRTLIACTIGLVALKVLSSVPLTRIRQITPVFLAAAFVLLLATHVIGSAANGAQSWIVLGPFQLQASEIAKLALVLYGVSLLADRPEMTRDLRGLMPFLLIAGAACGLIVLEPDLGTALVTSFALAALLIAAGMKLRHLAMIVAVLAFVALIGILIEPYRQDRLLNFLNPASDTGGSGFQAVQAKIAMGSGGIFGVGLGESVQKAFYLPEAHNDMIVAVIGEELGMIGMLLLAGLFMMFAFAGFRTAQQARDRYGRLLAAGLTAMIMVQATINLFAVMGLAPLTGITLPFVSYGNSSLVITLAAVGLLLNVASGGRAASSRSRLTPQRKTRATAAPQRRSSRASGEIRVTDNRPKRHTARRAAGTASRGGSRAKSADRDRRDGRARGSGAGRRRRAR